MLRLALAVLLAAVSSPAIDWERVSPADVGLDTAKLAAARDYALTGEGSGVIVRHGKLIYSWGDLERRYDLKSTTKSIGVTALGLAIADGKLRLDQKAVDCQPDFGVPPEQNRDTGWLPEITLFQLAAQTAGFDKPGGYESLLFEPGSQWSYSDGGPNWLAECVTLAYGRDVEELLFERVFDPLGIGSDDLRWRENQYRSHEIAGVARREFGSGVHANVQAMARLGQLYLNEGEWQGRRILPAEFVELATNPQSQGLPVYRPEEYPDASSHYGLLWWNNADGTLSGVPHDAYWSWGLYDSLIVVIPSLDLVIARAGKGWEQGFGSRYRRLEPFLQPIVAAAFTGRDRQPGQ